MARNLMKCCLVNKNERSYIFLLLKISYPQFYINISEIISLQVLVFKIVRATLIFIHIITFILDCKITNLEKRGNISFKLK